jgi:adenylate cyclase
VVGYSRLTEIDEEGTLRHLKRLRKELFEPLVAEHGGRIVKLMGDGALVEFPSAVDAVRCAVQFQTSIAESNMSAPVERRMEFRIGVNVGDIVVEGHDILGDGVNVAARLESLAEPGGVFISDIVHQSISGKIDVGFESLGEQHVKNISRPVHAFRALLLGSASRAEPGGHNGLSFPDKPSIAVLPFENMSADSEQEYFADGITEDVITELSRLRGFFVIARNSSFVYKGRVVSIADVARDLGVRYVLEGSVRRAGNRVRVTAQLIEASSGSHLWAERYDRTIEDIFELQDELTRQIVAALEPSMMSAEAERSERQRPENVDAWGYVARAMPLIWTWSADETMAAEKLLRKAIELDPNYARAHSVLALGYVNNAWFGRFGPNENFAKRAFEEAKVAVQLDGADPWGHLALGFVYGYRRKSQDSFAEIEQALKLNPNFALAHAYYGLVLGWAAESERALQHIDLAERLSPRDVINAHYPTLRGVAYFATGDYAAAAACARQTIRLRSDATGAHRVLAASCGLLNASDEASVAFARLRELQPDITLRWVETELPISSTEFRQRYVEGLRVAGVPE